jgi:hypothetical protein
MLRMNPTNHRQSDTPPQPAPELTLRLPPEAPAAFAENLFDANEGGD